MKQLSSARMAILEAQLGCSEAEKEAHLCREELERLRLDLEGEATARQEVQQQCKEMEAAVTRSEAQLKVACDRVAQSDAMAQLLKVSGGSKERCKGGMGTYFRCNSH